MSTASLLHPYNLVHLIHAHSKQRGKKIRKTQKVHLTDVTLLRSMTNESEIIEIHAFELRMKE